MPRARNRLVINQAAIDSIATTSEMAEVLDEIVRAGAAAAGDNAPVDTGELAGSYHGVVEDGVGYVYSDAEHAAYVELGTIDTPAQPHLRPAIDDMRRAAQRA